ncbi:MAG: ATP-binding protein, partial [Rudaea sp.]
FSYLEKVADFLREVTTAAGLDDRASYSVQMAVDEAVTNVIEHAYKGRHDGRIEILAERRGRDLAVEILDFGKPFDASHIRDPRVKGPLSRRAVGGLGIFFMKKLMDKVEFSSNADYGNRVLMTKRIR